LLANPAQQAEPPFEQLILGHLYYITDSVVNREVAPVTEITKSVVSRQSGTPHTGKASRLLTSSVCRLDESR